MPQDPKRLQTIEDRTYSFALALVKVFKKYPPLDQADRVSWNQLLKSGTSAGANSAEGTGTQSRADWRLKRFIALKEMREALFWLRLIRDASGRPRPELEPLIDEANQLVAILTVIAKKARENRQG